MALTRRTIAKKDVAVVEEPQTVICEVVETVIEKREIIRCDKCYFEVWRGTLCFNHWKQSQGLVFDEEKKGFVRRKHLGTH